MDKGTALILRVLRDDGRTPNAALAKEGCKLPVR